VTDAAGEILVSTAIEAEIETAGGDRPPSPLALLFAPDRAMERQARVGRVLWFLLFAWICSLALGATLAIRVDAGSSTLRKLETSGQLKGMSDRQIADETRSAERVFQVVSVGGCAAAVPLQLGLSCVAILGLCWFFRGRVKGSAVAPVAAATLLPGAIADGLDAVSAFRHAMLPPEPAPLSPRTLSAVLSLVGHPLGDPWVKLGDALDVYSLWAAVLLAYGVVAVGHVPRRTALAGTLIAWVCYRLLTHVAAGG
jgi:hypothetical protein